MDASLNETARALVAPGKGILAADESSGTIKKRFDSIGCESTEDRRRAYREMLFTTEGRGRLHQRRDPVRRDDPPERRPTAARSPKILEEQGIIPGIKVDKGTTPLAKSPGELVTDGLDGLRARLVEYRELGARFAKWRAVIDIGAGIPTQYCIDVNAHALARYAALCQDEGIVPIVEPEVLMDGDHSIERCSRSRPRRCTRCSTRCSTQRVELEGMLLKPNMVIPGKKYAGGQASPEAGRRRDDRVLPRGRARRGARHRVPVGRPERRGGDREPRRDQQAAARTRGSCRSPTAARCRPRRCSAWKGDDANIGRGPGRVPAPGAT